MLWNWLIDLAIIAYIAFGAWRGWREGLLVATVNLIGLLASFAAAFWLYLPISSWIQMIWTVPSGIANMFSFLLLAFAIDGAITSLILLAAQRWRSAWDIGRWNRLGVIPGMINSIITVGYLAGLVLALPLDHPTKVAVKTSIFGPLTAQTVERLGMPVQQLAQPAIEDLSELLTVKPGSDEFVELPFKLDNPALCSDAETDMLTLINKERANYSAPALQMNEPLRQLARSYSLRMYREGFFSHYTADDQDPFERMEAANITYQSAGENLALAPTLESAHTGLMNSPGHRRNILQMSFHKVGIGCYQDPRYGMMFTQEFTD